MMKNRFSDIQPYKPGKPIDEVKRELGLKHVVKLASNENPFPPSPAVLEALAREAKQVNRYPDGGCFFLRQALAKYLNVSKAHIVFGNGSDEVIVLAIRAFVEFGDEVVIAKPTFMVYEIASKIAGANIRAIPLKGFHYDLEGMLKAITDRTRIVFLGNPDNPAGQFIPQDDLRRFLDQVPSDVVVFLDEAYFEYVIDASYGNSIELLSSYPNIIVARTFSKMYGLAGLRVGYGVANKELIDILERLREPFNVNSMAQAAALACLKDQEYYRKVATSIEEQREILYQGLEEMKLEYVRGYTNFILVHVGQGANVMQALLRMGVIVRDMSHWGLDSYIRVSIGLEEENKKFLKAMKEVV